MNGLLIVSLSALWVVVLVNLALTLRIVRWIVSQTEARLRFLSIGEELTVGAPAPEFRARKLTGQPVTLEDYAGRRMAFVFSSPFCDQCRREMPELHSLAEQAAQTADTRVVIVSDGDLGTTRAWLDAMRIEDEVLVTLPVLVAPPTETTFTTDYNPVGAIPFFCLIEPNGTVALQGLVGHEEWGHITRAWRDRSQLAPWMSRGR